MSNLPSIEFVLCDVFAERPFAGNQLAVFLDAGAIPDESMADLMNEFGWSEITFVIPRQGAPPRVRIWTPGHELPFAGHPTLGTAVVLVNEGVLPAEGGVLELGIGPVEVAVDGRRATMTQRAPMFGRKFDGRDQLARALGLDASDLVDELPIQLVSTGLDHAMVPLRSLEALGRARPHPDLFPAVARELGVPWVYCFTVDTPQSPAAARTRLLGMGMDDPATGSAAGPLGAYLVYYGLHAPGDIELEQGIEAGRPSRIFVDVTREAGEIGPVRVTGEVHIWGRGSLR